MSLLCGSGGKDFIDWLSLGILTHRWSFIVKILIREAKRLRFEGDHSGESWFGDLSNSG